MNWLMDNPIAELYGPAFLLIDSVFVLLVIGHAWWSVRRDDLTADFDPPPIPSKPDPHAIAYLRGGANELIRLVVFDLLRRGFLQVDGTKRIEQAPDWPRQGLVSDTDHLVFAFFAVARKPEELFQSGNLAARVKEVNSPLEQALRDDQLLSPPEQLRKAWGVGLAGAFLILALGGFKLAVALAKGRSNVGFLVAIAVIGLVALAACCRVPHSAVGAAITWPGSDWRSPG